jgi:hypothetical protein
LSIFSDFFDYHDATVSFLDSGGVDLEANEVYGDFRLTEYDSTARENGLDLSQDGTHYIYDYPDPGTDWGYRYTPFNTDIADYERPQYTSWDIGASEAHPDYTSLDIDGTGGASLGGSASTVGNHLVTIGPGKDYESLAAWALGPIDSGFSYILPHIAQLKLSDNNLDTTTTTDQVVWDTSYGQTSGRVIEMDATSMRLQCGSLYELELYPGTVLVGDGTATVASVDCTSERHFVECYAFEDTSYPLITAQWQTNSESYIHIYTPESERHQGDLNSGYRLNGTQGIWIGVPNVWLDGLSINSGAHAIYWNSLPQSVDTSWIKISNCRINLASDPGYTTYGIVGPQHHGSAYIWNNIITRSVSIVYTQGMFIRYDSTYPDSSHYIYNNTVINMRDGIRCRNQYQESGDLIVRNCLSHGSSYLDFYPDQPFDAEYCACEDESLTGYALDNTDNQTSCVFRFVDSTNYFLSFVDSRAFNNGTDLSSLGLFNTDILGNPRPSWNNWSIGANEPDPIMIGGAILGERDPGGVLLYGEAVETQGAVEVVSGGAKLDGEALIIHGAPANGVALAGGETPFQSTFEIVAENGGQISGAASPAGFIYEEVGSGGAKASGESVPGFIVEEDGTGGGKVGGDSIDEISVFATGGAEMGGAAQRSEFIPIGGNALLGGEADESFILFVDYLNIPHGAANLLGNSTFVFWMKTDSTNEQAIISGANQVNDNEILIRLKSGTVISIANHTKGD